MKLFVVSRQDLSPGQQAVQGMHALSEFYFEHNNIAKEHHEKSNILVFLSVKDERALNSLIRKAKDKALSHSIFLEPDLQNELTAVAIESKGEQLVNKLNLALSANTLP